MSAYTSTRQANGKREGLVPMPGSSSGGIDVRR